MTYRVGLTTAEAGVSRLTSLKGWSGEGGISTGQGTGFTILISDSEPNQDFHNAQDDSVMVMAKAKIGTTMYRLIRTRRCIFMLCLAPPQIM
jgi:hypothetical protein